MTAPVRPLNPQQLREWLARGGEAPVILDVREPWEIAICSLPSSTHIPLGEITARARELPRDKDSVVLCHHGMRSLEAARSMSSLGFERIYNLQGGIDAWAHEIDPRIAKY